MSQGPRLEVLQLLKLAASGTVGDSRLMVVKPLRQKIKGESEVELLTCLVLTARPAEKGAQKSQNIFTEDRQMGYIDR